MKNSIKQFLFILAGTACLMLAAFYNKYPIVFSDTGTYIYSGFNLSYPNDRPISYGLFLRELSLNGKSLWLPVFAQSLILSFVLFLTIKIVLGESFRYWIALACFLFLSLFASASWVSSMVMADVFTPIGILSGIVILFGKLNKPTLAVLFAVFFLSAASHFSHILIFSLLFAFAAAFKKYTLPEKIHRHRYFRAIALVAITLSSIFIMRPSLNKGKYIMFASTMISQGITQAYLNEYCGTNHYKLCPYADTLPAINGEATWFEYNPNSPLNKLGGWSDSMRDECMDITYGTLTKPRYILMHISASLRCSFMQLYSFNTGGGNCPYLEELPVLINIKHHFNNELNQYSSSRQNKNTLLRYAGIWNTILTIVIIISLMLLLLFYFIRRSIYRNGFGAISIITIMGIILNAWDCGTFSDINLRYGSRVMWLIPLLAYLAVALFFIEKGKSKII